MNIRVPENLAYVDLRAAFNRAGIQLRYVDGGPTITGISRESPPWRNPVTDPPDLLTDVSVTVIGDDGLPMTDMGFLRRPDQWVLTGMERIVNVLAWMPLPAPHKGAMK